jgi:hypothetical protein
VRGRSTFSNLIQFTNGVIGKIEDAWQVDGVYTDFSKAFDRVRRGLLKFNLSILFVGSLLCWMGSYLISRTHRVQLEDYLSELIQCHFRVTQGSHLGPKFFILDINGALYLFKNVSLFGYTNELKLLMTIKCIGDCQLFQRDLDRLDEWCSSNKFGLNAGKCKSKCFCRNRTALERVNEIKDLGVIMHGRMSYLPHIEAIISTSSRILGFIKRISREFYDPYTHKNLEHAAFIWMPHQLGHSERLE